MPEENASGDGGLNPAPLIQTQPTMAPALTQADVDKATKAAADAARRDEAKRHKDFLEAQKAEVDAANQTELERAQSAAAEATAKAEAATRALAQRDHDSLVRERLEAAGVPRTASERASTMIVVPVGATEAEIDTDVATLKETFPQVFSTQTPAPDPQTVRPATPPPVRTGGESEFERGQRESLQRRGLLKSA